MEGGTREDPATEDGPIEGCMIQDGVITCSTVEAGIIGIM